MISQRISDEQAPLGPLPDTLTVPFEARQRVLKHSNIALAMAGKD